MPKLVLTKGGQVISEHKIVEQYTLIGRAARCDLRIDDETISQQHFRIICILDDCFMEDLNSTNGTIVNGRLTKKCPMEHGDLISIGQYEIKYDTAPYKASSDENIAVTNIKLIKQLGKPEIAAATDEQSANIKNNQNIVLPTQDIDSGADLSQSTNLNLQANHNPDSPSRTKAENPNSRIGNLIIVSGKKEGHKMSLNRPVTRIGKDGQRVAAITRRPDGYFLVPLDGATPKSITVKVNGSEINRKIYPLWSNDTIELDGTKMEFNLGD